MEPEMIHTECYRGFYAIYELTEEALYLRELTLREKNENYMSYVKERKWQQLHHRYSLEVRTQIMTGLVHPIICFFPKTPDRHGF